MIIDKILDRRDGCNYSREDARYIYEESFEFGFWELSRALDGGTDDDVKRELCRYIDMNDYNPEIKNYINSVSWVF